MGSDGKAIRRPDLSQVERRYGVKAIEDENGQRKFVVNPQGATEKMPDDEDEFMKMMILRRNPNITEEELEQNMRRGSVTKKLVGLANQEEAKVADKDREGPMAVQGKGTGSVDQSRGGGVAG